MKDARVNYSELLAEHNSLLAQLAAAQTEISALTVENQALKKRLNTYAKPVSAASSPPSIETDEDSQECANCRQAIPTQNFAMHTLHCERMNKRCAACGELVPASELTAHTNGLKEDVAALFGSAEKGDISSVETRLRHGADISATSPDAMRNSLLHSAVKGGAQSLVELLLAKGLSVNARNAYGETPLHVAMTHSRSGAMASYLLSQGADPLLQNSLGDSPYALAMRQADHELMLAFTQFANQSRPSSSKPRTASARSRPKPAN